MENKKIFVVLGQHNFNNFLNTPVFIGVFDKLEDAIKVKEKGFEDYKDDDYSEEAEREEIDEYTSLILYESEGYYIKFEIIETTLNKFINYELE
nr:MAG TPA: hypothetical protein [Caudoviricetes sp.]